MHYYQKCVNQISNLMNKQLVDIQIAHLANSNSKQKDLVRDLENSLYEFFDNLLTLDKVDTSKVLYILCEIKKSKYKFQRFHFLKDEFISVGKNFYNICIVFFDKTSIKVQIKQYSSKKKFLREITSQTESIHLSYYNRLLKKAIIELEEVYFNAPQK